MSHIALAELELFFKAFSAFALMRENKLLVQLLLQLMLRFFALFRVFSLYFRYFSSNPEIKVRIYALMLRINALMLPPKLSF